jgi:hypothetical protein
MAIHPLAGQPEQKTIFSMQASPQVQAADLAGEKIVATMTTAPRSTLRASEAEIPLGEFKRKRRY